MLKITYFNFSMFASSGREKLVIGHNLLPDIKPLSQGFLWNQTYIHSLIFASDINLEYFKG